MDQGAAEIFGNRLYQENEKQREGEDGPDVVNARGNEIVQVDDVIGAGNLEEVELLDRGLRIQDDVESGLDGEGDETVGDAHDGHEQNAASQRAACKERGSAGAAGALRAG